VSWTFTLCFCGVFTRQPPAHGSTRKHRSYSILVSSWFGSQSQSITALCDSVCANIFFLSSPHFRQLCRFWHPLLCTDFCLLHHVGTSPYYHSSLRQVVHTYFGFGSWFSVDCFTQTTPPNISFDSLNNTDMTINQGRGRGLPRGGLRGRGTHDSLSGLRGGGQFRGVPPLTGINYLPRGAGRGRPREAYSPEFKGSNSGS
jgi:hypothetical protein